MRCEQHILTLESNFSCLESYHNLSIFIEKDYIATEGIDLKKISSDFIIAIKKFFKKLRETVKNYWHLTFGKDGKLVNIRAVKVIDTNYLKWSRSMTTVTGPLLKATINDDIRAPLKKASDVFDEIDKEAELLLHKVNTEVINSPKISDYKFYKTENLNSFDKMVDYIEDISMKLMKKATQYETESRKEGSESIYAIYQQLIMIMTKTCTKVVQAILNAVTKATYTGKKDNVKVDLDAPIEVEVVFD